MQVQKVLNNKYFLKGLEKISEHGTSFLAGASLVMSTTLRPASIALTPDTEKENKQYAIANSISSGLVKFAIIESVALPVESAIKRIDSNPQKYLNNQTLKNLPHKAYKLITQTMKLGAGLLTAIPKSMLAVALIPVIMDKVFHLKPSQKNMKFEKIEKNNEKISFTGLSDKISSKLGKIVDNKKVQKYAIKYQDRDKDIAKHITALTDVLLTLTSVYKTNKSDGIKENRKRALIYNNIISTAITILGGYALDRAVKKKTDKFIIEFSQINKGNPKLPKYIEGINILRPALIFAGIYYGVLPMFSTYIAEKIDKAIGR